MFGNRNPPVQAKREESAIYRAISAIGTALGIGAAILTTPLIFGWTRGPLFEYLLQTWSADIAELLTWVFAGVEAVIIYGSTKLLFTSALIGGIAAIAAKRLPH